jgi:hypothetical protein
MNLAGVTIDNNGTTMTPCIETRCDSSYIYIDTNALPSYDFQQTTPNALVQATFIYRVPYTPTAIPTAGATNTATLNGCYSAYTDYVNNSAPTTDPSGNCGGSGSYYTTTSAGNAYFHELPCGGTTGFVVSGVPTVGPNEAQMPDPWGNPAYYWPAAVGDSYLATGDMSAALDLCGGHTSPISMHYHAAYEACFAETANGAPENSYVNATASWNYDNFITEDCTTASPIVGWIVDGYPIRGSCVCTARNGDGSCATVKRARSSWVYDGLSAWSNGAVSGSLSAENTSCTQTSDCCPGSGSCNFKCAPVLINSASTAGGTELSQQCVLLDYSWCANQYVDRTAEDVSSTNYVYTDRCNGYDGPDGYSYYATGSFPFLQGCYHGVPSSSSGGATTSVP